MYAMYLFLSLYPELAIKMSKIAMGAGNWKAFKQQTFCCPFKSFVSSGTICLQCSTHCPEF